MRELVLTGHKDLWPVSEEQSLFLGDHCFCYNHKYEFHEQDRFHIAPSPWKSAQDIFDSAAYIDGLYDRIIPEMTVHMNSLYGLSYSEKFWNIYMVLWLYQWLGIAYDRYRRLEYVGECLKERFVVKVINELDKRYGCESAVTNAQGPILKLIHSHYHNFVLLSDIIDHARFDFLDHKKVSVLPEAAADKNSLGFKSSVRNLLSSSQEKIRDCLNNFFTSSVFFGTIYGISLRDKIYLQFSRDPAFLFKKKPRAPGVRARKVVRSDINNINLKFEAKNRFEQIVKEILLKYIPDSILTVHEFSAETYPNIKVWVGNDIFTSQKKCFEIASVLERGGRWISSQHGGCYGQSLSFPIGKIEYEASGEFMTWGWEYKHIYNSAFYPLPSPMLSRLKKHKEGNDSIILVGCTMPSYKYRLESFMAPGPLINYTRARLIFLERLDKEILKKIKFKPSPHNFGAKETELVESLLSEDQILTGGRLTGFFHRTRLAVIDHPGTSLHEALAMNTPTILFWEPAQFAFCKEAMPFFKRLRDAGMLFDDPEAGAKKVNEIWEDVKGWWSDPVIQRAKNDFCFQFARSQADWRKEWVQFSKNL